MERPRYVDLYFGLSDSRNEAAEDRDAFVRTYVDIHEVTASVIRGQKFLVLGPKGTGKSALAWYLEATELDATHLALVRDSSDLPLAEVPRLQTGQDPGPERTVVAWKFILLCNYLELLLRDQSSSIHLDAEVHRVTDLLRDYGFIGDASGRALLTWSTSTITIPIPKLGNLYQRESKKELNIYNLLPYMQSWATDAHSQLRHVLLLDGLDSIYLNDSRYDQSLASLVQATYSLNQKLRSRRATGSIVLLMRNDVFSRIALSLPDSQKMKDDLAIDLDWRVLSGQEGVNAPLMQLVNIKAARGAGLESVSVLEYFPKEVTVGGRAGGRQREFPTLKYLLNMTRHTPRDLLRLFEEVRKVEQSGTFPPSGDTLSQEVIREGVLRYSTGYFTNAIRNEFAGYAGGPESAAAALTALKAINARIFDAEDFATALADTDAAFAPLAKDLLRLLFFAGAIGNLVGAGQSEKSYMQFYHRRDESEIYVKGQFILHHALVHAWSVPWTRHAK